MKIVKLLVTITVLVIFAWAVLGSVYAATQEDFTLTVLKDNNPVREFSGEVAIPFDTEYKLRLKNNNHRRCSATIWIDGAKVSEMGNFIIGPTDHLDLERFLNESLTEGKRFKFVPLDHPAVDDPNRVENGVIKVEFRLEKLQQIMPKDRYIIKIPKYGDPILWEGVDDEDLNYYFNDDGMLVIIPGGQGHLWSNTINTLLYDGELSTTDASTGSILCSNTSAGATVPGSYSSQSFYKVDFDGGDETVTIQLKMVGI